MGKRVSILSVRTVQNGKKNYSEDGLAATRTHLLAQIDVLDDLKRERVVAEEDVHTEETDDREVSEKAVERLGAVLADNLTAACQ